MTNTKNISTNQLLALAQVSPAPLAWEMLTEVANRTGYVRTWGFSQFALHGKKAASVAVGCLRTEIKRHVGARSESRSFYFHGSY